MDKVAQVHQAFKSLMPPAPTQVWQAVVKSIQGANCTVDIVGTDLVDVPEVNLRANDEATEGVLFVPRVGSLVYVGAVENALDNLFVCLVSEVDRVEAKIDGVTLVLDKDGATMKQAQAEISLKQGKVSVKNNSTNLKDLFDSLTQLLNGFTVITPVQGAPTPSASVDPGTITKITQLSTKVSQLLA